MKFEFRGELNNGSIVDIFKFEKDIAICDANQSFNIDEFTTIFYQKDKFKKEVLDIKTFEEVKVFKKKEKIIK